MTHEDFYDASGVRSLRHRLNVVCVLVVLSYLFCSCTPKQDVTRTPTPVIPAVWTPSLEQVQEDFKEAVERNPNKNQQALNRASQNMADLLDARLFIIYVKLMDALAGAAKLDLFNEQEQWLSKRRDLAQGAVTSKGGSLQPLEYSGAYRKVTNERLLELQSRLKQVKGSAG